MKLNKSQLAWVSYDFANSAFHLIIPTVLFPLYFKAMLAADVSSGDFAWSLIVSLPVLIVGLISPFIGAYIDNKHNNRKFFIFVTLSTILLNFALGIISPSFNKVNIFLFSLCLMFFNLSQFSYDAFLPSQKKGKGVAALSGIGWGTGYLGGILCMIPIFLLTKGKTLPADYSAYQLGFLVVAFFYLIFTLPSFLFIKSGISDNKQADRVTENPYKKVVASLKNWKYNKHIFIFLIAFYLINDGLSTLVYFTSLFASETLGMNTSEILISFLVVQLIGVPATIFFCQLSEKLGYMRTFVTTVIIWILLGIAFVVLSTKIQFYVLSFFVGLVIGTTPALARAIISSYLEKRNDATEIFGFNSMASRTSSIFGPLLFGVVSTAFQSQKVGLLSLTLFFSLGLIMLLLNRKNNIIINKLK
ncbi:MAG: MFS transporter [Tannerella sp.]|jgi:UMF1 family MFS transporter|nr:MFS transporter [Tannerella sp.]